jgi:tetratricopeptide (TPR) repeat protein
MGELRERIELGWREHAAEHLDRMLASREETWECLKHVDAKIRSIAVQVLHEHWNIDISSAHLGFLEEVAFGDPDAEVRGMAIVTLVRCYQRTDDLRIGCRLANVVRDEQENQEIRSVAYRALYAIHGRVPTFVLQYRNAAADFTRPHVPDDVDWDYVNRFLNTSRVADPVPEIPETSQNAGRETQLLFTYWREAQAAVDRGDDRAALRPMAAALCLERSPGAYLGRARAYLRLGQLNDALADCNEAVRIAPNLAVAYEFRAEVQECQGLIELANADRAKARRLRANQPPAV